MKKRVISTLLVLCMVLTMLPMMALATETGRDSDPRHPETAVTPNAEPEEAVPEETPEPDPVLPEDPVDPIPVEEITLSESRVTLTVGETLTLAAAILPEEAADTPVIWASRDPEVVTVDETGTLTAVSPGTTTVTAKAGNQTAYCFVTVEEPKPVPVAEIILSETEFTLAVGQSKTLTAKVLPEDATEKTVTWTSSDPDVVTVDQDGTLTALTLGSAVITAEADDISAACTITVTEPVLAEEILFEEEELTLLAGETMALTVTILPEDTTDKTVTWTSSDPEIAEVDPDGNLTAISVGSAVITAETAGLTDTCTVTVKFADVPEDAYYHDDVYWALENGITEGTSGAAFSPDETCTRAEAMTFIWRINGSPAPTAAPPFEDVAADAYYYDAVAWAYENEIVVGTSATQFSPDKTCTRAEIITMIWRCLRQWPSGTSSFQDVTTPSYYYHPVVWATEVGITNGYNDTTFGPDDPCTRAHIVRFLHNCDANGYAKLDKSAWELYYPKAAAVLDQVGWNLRAAFDWSASLTYYGHGAEGMPDDPSPGIEWFADFGFTNLKGNCYVMAATFYEMAVLLGYAPRQMSGEVPLASGGVGPHSWVEIDFDGQTYVFDPDFTYGTGRNGYMITYGQSGTWRYSNYSPMSR